MMSSTFGLFTQVGDSGPDGPLDGILVEGENIYHIPKEIRCTKYLKEPVVRSISVPNHMLRELFAMLT